MSDGSTSRTIFVNGSARAVAQELPDEMPLLWVLRDVLDLTGTKFGCGVGQCGACTVLEDGRATASCLTPFGSTSGRRYVTVEGLAALEAGAACQRAWIAEDVAQCGYCQPGFLAAAADLLTRRPSAASSPEWPTDSEIDQALAGHICRCGTYVRLRRAVRRAAFELSQRPEATTGS